MAHLPTNSAPPATFSAIHPAGRLFVAGFALATGLLFWAAGPIGWIGVLATVCCAAFFRDPERFPPMGEGLVLSPADGVVVAIAPAEPPADLGVPPGPRTRISIFLSLLDVHVNRVPVEGRIQAIRYRPGKFFNASLDKASDENERNAIHIVTPSGADLVVVQIAGLVARRILCGVAEGDEVTAGERFGIIRFGSRADIYLPDGVIPLVALGQTMIGGETILARLKPAGSQA